MAAIDVGSGSGPQNKLALENGLKNTEDISFIGSNGKPLVRISCAASELIPTVQYGNVNVGPVSVTRYFDDTTDDDLKKNIRLTQSICEEAVAEDRQSVHALTRQSTEGRYQA